MLPSVPELAGLVVLALIAAGAVTGMVKGWTRDPAERSDARLQIALPLFALALIALPYLPILPDIVRPLRAFAGPIVWLIWIAIAGLAAMTALAVRHTLLHERRSAGGTRLAGTIAVFLITLTVAGIAGVRLRDSLAYPSGDSPHYMVMMESLWRDHDLAVQNNYVPRSENEDFPRPLTLDAPSVGKNGTIYSTRPVGVALAWCAGACVARISRSGLDVRAPDGAHRHISVEVGVCVHRIRRSSGRRVGRDLSRCTRALREHRRVSRYSCGALHDGGVGVAIGSATHQRDGA